MKTGFPAVGILVLLPVLVGCATGREQTARVHLRDYFSNDFADGIATERVFAIAGDTVLPSSKIRFSVVPRPEKVYQQVHAPEEYYVDITWTASGGHAKRYLFLFHQDFAGNEGVTRIELKRGGYDCVDLPCDEIPDLKWRILHSFTVRYRGADDIPENVLDFMRLYGMFWSPFIRSGREAVPDTETDKCR